MKKPQLLLVEDEKPLSSNLRELLEEHHYQVQLAHDQSTALALLNANHYKMAVLDLNLPDGHGLEIFQQLKKIHPQCYTIIITGQASVENTVQALNEGVDAFLIKPFTVEAFEAVLSQAETNLKLREEKEQLFDKLQKTKQFYENLLNSTREAILVIDLDFTIRYWNRAARQLLGLSTGSLDIHNLQDYIVDGFKVLNHLYKQLLLGKVAGWHPIQLKTSTGEKIELNLTGHFLHDASGRVDGMIVTLESTALRNELISEIVRREKIKTIVNLASVLAHEIRNPANIVSGRLQLLRKEIGAGKHQRAFETIQRQVDRIANITDQLSMFEFRRMDTIPESFSLLGFLDKFIQQSGNRFNNIRFELAFPHRLREILLAGNQTHFQDAFGYLFEALNQSLQEPVTLTLRCYLSRSVSERPMLEIEIGANRPLNFRDIFGSAADPAAHLPNLGVTLMQIIFANYGGDFIVQEATSQTATLRLRFPVYELTPEEEPARKTSKKSKNKKKH
ncbi:MAG: hybrid sensor histidine kinase/response regulator [Calditrichaeota bacterium]|nr:MAG: hybrid sensor histidine kinase/response regulator [Calditrichota bacterium]